MIFTQVMCASEYLISWINSFYKKSASRFPCLDTVKLLLHCGASANSSDIERNSPLHTLAATFYRSVSDEMIYKAEEITKLLTNAGLHLDAVNCEGATAARICSSREIFLHLKCITK